MTAAFKEVGIKVIVDIVPNHSSNDHEWFQAALKAGKGSPERERYIFRDGLGPNQDQPPSDWECEFGGNAWEPVGDGQFYLHLFDSSQPDFNWDNREVRDDFLKTLKFWADRGVSGFRIDVAHGCAKDLGETLVSQRVIEILNKKMIEGTLKDDEHPFWDRNAVFDIYAEWRELFNKYDPPLTGVAEAWVSSRRKPLYASPKGLGQAFSFDMLVASFDATQFRKVITQSLTDAKKSGSSTTWVFSNHDVVRHATRLALENDGGYRETARKYLLNRGKNPVADVELGLRRATAATLLILALPGSAYIYQGEELGLPEHADMPDEERQDPTFFRRPGVDVGRDGCRTCLPWEAEAKNMGFGPDEKPHLPQPEVYKKYAVDIEDANPKSTLNLYRTALSLRHKFQCAEELEWLGSGEETEVIHFKRPNGWEVIVNFGDEPVQIPVDRKVAAASSELVGNTVPRATTVWLVPV
jgi:alpha-glucosidase